MRAQHLKFLSYIPDNLPAGYVRIQAIHFRGNTITKEKIMDRELTLHVGDSILAKELQGELQFNVRRLLNLQLFSTVKYSVRLVQSDQIEITYEVTEVLYWIARPIFSLADRNFNVWLIEQHHNFNRTNYGATITRHNFRGRNEELSGTLQLGYNKLFEFSYRIPYIDKKLRQGIGFSASYATGEEVNYITTRNKLKFFHHEHYPYERMYGMLHYLYRKAYATSHEVQLAYHKYEITEELHEKNPDFLGGPLRVKYMELNYIFQYNNTDVRVYPTNGFDVKLIASKKGFGFNQAINRFDLISQSSFYYRLATDWSLSWVFRGRLSFPQKQPYFINRALGFKNEYVRGYEYYVIDGGHYGLLRTNLRYKIIDRVLHQNRFRILKHIPVRVYGKLFDDLGYAYNEFPGTSFLNNRMLNGYGAGVDIMVSYYARLRIEYSFNHLNQNGLFLHGSKE
ncbi:MAG: BamA/TamA family outer membrane protein [Chitinophagaceae bacterium]|nr:BamA/TamA family outer membrane protein [Chitinophagaceae bacterium]